VGENARDVKSVFASFMERKSVLIRTRRERIEGVGDRDGGEEKGRTAEYLEKEGVVRHCPARRCVTSANEV